MIQMLDVIDSEKSLKESLKESCEPNVYELFVSMCRS